VFPPDAEFEEVQCSTMGVFAPLVGIIGAMQAAEALKLLTWRRAVAGRAPAHARWPHHGVEYPAPVPRDPACAVCGKQ
jgi:molybdopterin/thiamine biosynthesis adenylyltransferase